MDRDEIRLDFRLYFCPQASGTVAALRLDLWKTRGSELGGDGVQHSDPILHAAVRHPEHRLFQVADEQGPRVHHVPPLLRLRRRLADVRVRVPGLSGLRTREERAFEQERERKSRGPTRTADGRTFTGLVIVIIIVVGEWSTADERNLLPRAPHRSKRGKRKTR